MYEPRLCNEYIKGVDAFLISQRKTCCTTLEEIFVVLVNIARMRRDIVQMMC
jgi:hypothetical protein